MGVDVTIRGAGIFGLSCAWACMKRGATVRVIDPGGPGAGASGGLLGALAPHTPENWNPKKDFQFQSLLASGPFWAEVEAISGMASGYARCGRLQPLADDRAVDLARRREVGAADLWQGHALWSVVPATGDWSPASPTGLMIHDTLSARLHPRLAIAALAEALRRKGVEITPDGPQQGRVIWATGVAGLTALSEDLGQPVGTAQKGQSAVLAFARPNAPQIFADGLYILPHSDGTTAIGSTSERDFVDPTATDAQLDALIARARTEVNLLADAPVIAKWAGLRPRAASRAPVLGEWPGRPGHYIANGGFKIGFGMAPRVGEVMARLVVDGDDLIPEEFKIGSKI